MKNHTPAMKAWYAAGAPNATTCWRAVLQNGRVVAATKLDRDLPIDGIVYQTTAGFLDSDVASSSELNPDNLEVEGFLQSPAITDADIHSGAWDYAYVEMFETCYTDTSIGKNILRTGTLGEVKGGRIKFTAELRGLMQAYTNTVVRLMTKDCNADLGDSRCKVIMSPFTATGTVGGTNTTNSVIYDTARTEAGPDGAKAITGISRAENAVITCPGHGFAQNATVQLSDIVGCTLSGATKDGVFYNGSGDGLNGMLFQITLIDADHFSILVDTRGYNADQAQGVTDPLQVYSPYVSGGLAHPANASGYFDHGKITFTSGANAGLSMEVKAYAPGTITLMLPMPFEIAVGDAYSVKAGCNQSFEMCQQRFNNVVNFRGFPNLPQSKIYRRGAEGVGTDGGSVSGSGTGASGGSGGTGGSSGTGILSGTVTGYIMPNSVETTFLGDSAKVPPPGGAYFASDLVSPPGAKILGFNYNGARGVLVGGSVSEPILISDEIRNITKDELVAYLNLTTNMSYGGGVTTPPPTGITIEDTGPVPVNKGGFDLTYRFQVVRGYTTTTGSRRVWHKNSTDLSASGMYAWSPTLGKFAALSGWQSTDGKTWENNPLTVISSEPTFQRDIRSVMIFMWSVQAGKFIYYTLPTAGGGGGYFMGSYVPYNTMVSDDGIAFREQIGAPGVAWKDIIQVPDKGITVGIATDVSGISYDGGLTWSLTPLSYSSGAIVQNLKIAFAPELNLFVAVFQSTDRHSSMTSHDGINWTIGDTPPGFWHTVEWVSQLGMFIAGGTSNRLADYSGSDVPYAYGIMTSPDGANWTPNQNAPFYPASYGGATWYPELNMVAMSGTTKPWLTDYPYPHFRIYSSDGINWTSMVPCEDEARYVPELGLFVDPSGWGDSTFEPETTYYWPYEDWKLTYSAT